MSKAVYAFGSLSHLQDGDFPQTNQCITVKLISVMRTADSIASGAVMDHLACIEHSQRDIG